MQQALRKFHFWRYAIVLCVALTTLICAWTMSTQRAPVAYATTQSTFLPVRVTYVQAVAYRSSQISVHTRPHAAVRITIVYSNGLPALNNSLRAIHYTDDNGNYTWTWVPDTDGTFGTAIVNARWYTKMGITFRRFIIREGYR